MFFWFRNIGGIGKKVNERVFKCKRFNNLRRDIFNYGVGVIVNNEDDINDESDVFYKVLFVYNIVVIICYGCEGRVREKLFVFLFYAFYDIFIYYKERRIYNYIGEIIIRISLRLEMVYYYFLRFCIGFNNDDNVKKGSLLY